MGLTLNIYKDIESKDKIRRSKGHLEGFQKPFFVFKISESRKGAQNLFGVVFRI